MEISKFGIFLTTSTPEQLQEEKKKQELKELKSSLKREIAQKYGETAVENSEEKVEGYFSERIKKLDTLDKTKLTSSKLLRGFEAYAEKTDMEDVIGLNAGDDKKNVLQAESSGKGQQEAVEKEVSQAKESQAKDGPKGGSSNDYGLGSMEKSVDAAKNSGTTSQGVRQLSLDSLKISGDARVEGTNQNTKEQKNLEGKFQSKKVDSFANKANAGGEQAGASSLKIAGLASPIKMQGPSNAEKSDQQSVNPAKYSLKYSSGTGSGREDLLKARDGISSQLSSAAVQEKKDGIKGDIDGSKDLKGKHQEDAQLNKKREGQANEKTAVAKETLQNQQGYNGYINRMVGLQNEFNKITQQYTDEAQKNYADKKSKEGQAQIALQAAQAIAAALAATGNPAGAALVAAAMQVLQIAIKAREVAGQTLDENKKREVDARFEAEKKNLMAEAAKETEKFRQESLTMSLDIAKNIQQQYFSSMLGINLTENKIGQNLGILNQVEQDGSTKEASLQRDLNKVDSAIDEETRLYLAQITGEAKNPNQAQQSQQKVIELEAYNPDSAEAVEKSETGSKRDILTKPRGSASAGKNSLDQKFSIFQNKDRNAA